MKKNGHRWCRACVSSLVILLFLSALWQRCANIVPPSGGPKDTIPPVLVSVVPPDSTLHFHSDRIVFTFNEFVQLANNYNDVLIFSPRMRRQPIINVKLRTITILLKDTLKPNTTYQINFGNAIQDINEGNAIPNFTYIFSTGSYLDSLQISGVVRNAETGLPDSNVVVMLYTDLRDSVVSKEKPLYYTRSGAGGYFAFHHLPADTFKIFALKDENNSLMYDDIGKESIAYLSHPIVLTHNLGGVKLYLFREKLPADTTHQQMPPAVESSTNNAFQAQPTLSNGRQSLIEPLQLVFTQPIARIDTAGIALLADTILRPVPFSIQLDDTTHRYLQIKTTWQESIPYQLRIRDSAIWDTAHRPLPADTIRFQTKSLSDYGSVKLELHGLDSSYTHYVLQLVNSNQQVVYHTPIRNRVINIGLFDPGDYQIRILLDSNDNGYWDTGSYYGPDPHQPERVIAVPGKITVRANWDNAWIVEVPSDLP
ncbi:MAG: Ig-like domain-containing protein [Thermoflavifilum sp.]|nr:Ig-like domain-containing protein [Thermoflavifilum sp.]